MQDNKPRKMREIIDHICMLGSGIQTSFGCPELLKYPIADNKGISYNAPLAQSVRAVPS